MEASKGTIDAKRESLQGLEIVRTRSGFATTISSLARNVHAPKALSGSLRDRGQNVQVYLIVAETDAKRNELYGPTVLDEIFKFLESHLQCFVTKEAAAYMYYKLASRGKTVRWRGSKDITGWVEQRDDFERIGAWSDRGLRSLTDRDGILMGLRGQFAENDTFLSSLEDVEWSYAEGHPERLRGIDEQELLADLMRFGCW